MGLDPRLMSPNATSRRAAIAVLVTLGCVVVLAGGTRRAVAAGAGRYGVTCVARPAPIPSDVALTDVSDAVHSRLRTYTVRSPAVGVTRVNVLLPVHYDPASSKRYPVLYLLRGAEGSYADWASTAEVDGEPQGGDVEALVGTLPLIVVMPDDSANGSYSDWYGISAKDAAMKPEPATPSWETYDIDELVPWVDSTFPTQATAAGRAIAGLSSGGGGAAKYATAHPGMFGFVGMFSGALDNDLVDSSINWYVVSDALSTAGPPDDHCTFGDPFTGDAENQAYYWHDNDPTYEASNLAGVKLFVASGNGTPTSADAHTDPAIRTVEGQIEAVVDDMSRHFVAAVRAAGLGANLTTDFYGDGVHAWHYWQRDFSSFLAWLGPQLNRPLATPMSFSYRTARATSGAWGWSFHFDSGLSLANVNTAEEFMYMSHVSTNGFDAAGNGTLGVVTPKGSYRPLSSHDVIAGGVTKTITANRAGQLRFTVVIGPRAVHRQLAFPASGPPTEMPRVEVSITPTPAPVRGARPGHGASPFWLLPLGTGGAAVPAIAVIGGGRRRSRSARRSTPVGVSDSAA